MVPIKITVAIQLYSGYTVAISSGYRAPDYTPVMIVNTVTSHNQHTPHTDTVLRTNILNHSTANRTNNDIYFCVIV